MAVKIEPLGDRFVNLFLIHEPAGLTLVDAGTPAGPRVVERALRREGLDPSAIRSILITHADPDHVGGAAALQRATGAELYAGELEAEALARGVASREPLGSPALMPLLTLMDRMMPITPARASHTIGPGDELPILGGLRVLGTPGHTPGHLSFYAPRYGLLFAGDSLMAIGGRLRFLDGPFTWDYERGRESVRRQAALAPRVICCGHGPVVHNTPIPAI